MPDDPKPPMSAEEMAMRVVDSDSFSDATYDLDAWEAEIRADEWRLADATIEQLRAERDTYLAKWQKMATAWGNLIYLDLDRLADEALDAKVVGL